MLKHEEHLTALKSHNAHNNLALVDTHLYIYV